MTTVAATPAEPPPALGPFCHPITVGEYFHMGEAAVLDADAPVRPDRWGDQLAGSVVPQGPSKPRVLPISRSDSGRVLLPSVPSGGRFCGGRVRSRQPPP